MSDRTDEKNDKAPAVPAGPSEVVKAPSALAIPDEARLQTYLADSSRDVERDPERIADSIVARILAADDVLDVLAPQAVEHARDLIDQPIRINRARLNESDFDTGPGFYAIVEAEVLNDGRITTFSCGGRNVLAQLYKLAQLQAFPIDVAIRQSPRETKNGGRPMWLEALGPRDAVTGRLERDRPAVTS